MEIGGIKKGKIAGLLSIVLGFILCGLPIERVEPAPTGGVVSAGQATIDQSKANTTLIQQKSHSTVIDWATFNVGASESVIFRQPSSTATALNRIHDQNPSQIFGSIQANGRIYLMNPNGIVFGSSARVNVGSLFATTLGISDEDFLKGNYQFKQLQGQVGTVINRGLINASSGGFVALVGNRVENHGSIIANMGHVQLSSATAVTIDFDGDGLIQFQVTDKVISNPNNSDSAVLNTGTIKADGGTIVLSAKAASGVFTNVVNNTGLVQANRVVRRGGVIRLLGEGGTVRNAGSLRANNAGKVLVHSDGLSIIDNGSVVTATGPEGGSGGTVHILGDTVALLGNAKLDASGDTGGGEILIGGDFQGKGTVPNAQYTFVDEAVTITADAKQKGDGGEVIVWSDIHTVFYGSFSAVGGPQGGDGGFAEVSGKQVLTFEPKMADLRAPKGVTGTLLLDPFDIIIQDGGSDTDIVVTIFPPALVVPKTDAEITNTPAPPPPASVITTTTINNLLANTIIIIIPNGLSVGVRTGPNLSATGNVTIKGTITAPANSMNNFGIIANDIFIDPGGVIDFSAANNSGRVGLNAQGSLIHKGVINMNTGDLELAALDTISIEGSIVSKGGNILLTFSDVINVGVVNFANIGSVNAIGITLNAADRITVGNAIISTNGGTVTIDADSNNSGPGTFNMLVGSNIDTNTGTVSIKASNIITNQIRGTGVGGVELTATRGSILDRGSLRKITADNLTMTATTGIGTMNNNVDTQVENLTTTTTDSDQFIKEVDLLSSLNLDAGTGNVALITGGKATDGDTDVDVKADTFTLSTGGAVDIDTDASIIMINSTGGNDVLVTDSGNTTTISVNVATIGTGSVMFTQTANSIFVDLITTNGDVALRSLAGAINDLVPNNSVTDITANSVDLDASTGIGNTADIELNINGMITADTTNGAINLVNNATGASAVNSLTTGSGAISYITSGSATFATITSNNPLVTLNAVNGITLTGAVTSNGGDVRINADSNADASGTFTMTGGVPASIFSGGGTVSITAADMVLNATAIINSGTGDTIFIPSISVPIGLGSATGGFTLTNAELSTVAAGTTLFVGNSSSGPMTVTGVNFMGNFILQTGSTIAVNSLNVSKDALILAVSGITVGQMTTTGASILISTKGSITSMGGATPNVTGNIVVIAAGGVTPPSSTVGTPSQAITVSSPNTIKVFSGSPQLFISANNTVEDTKAAYFSSIVPFFIPESDLFFGTTIPGKLKALRSEINVTLCNRVLLYRNEYMTAPSSSFRVEGVNNEYWKSIQPPTPAPLKRIPNCIALM